MSQQSNILTALIVWLLGESLGKSFQREPSGPKPSEQWFRHYYSTVAYFSGSKRRQQFYALTFDIYDDDKTIELEENLAQRLGGLFGAEDFGYSVTESEEGRDSGNTYPNIEVGEL